MEHNLLLWIAANYSIPVPDLWQAKHDKVTLTSNCNAISSTIVHHNNSSFCSVLSSVLNVVPVCCSNNSNCTTDLVFRISLIGILRRLRLQLLVRSIIPFRILYGLPCRHGSYLAVTPLFYAEVDWTLRQHIDIVSFLDNGDNKKCHFEGHTRHGVGNKRRLSQRTEESRISTLDLLHDLQFLCVLSTGKKVLLPLLVMLLCSLFPRVASFRAASTR